MADGRPTDEDIDGSGRGRSTVDWLAEEGPGPAHMGISKIKEDRCLHIPWPCRKCAETWLPTGTKKISLLAELAEEEIADLSLLIPRHTNARSDADTEELLDRATTMFRAAFQEGHTVTLSLPVIAHVLGGFQRTGTVWVVGLPDRLRIMSDRARLRRLGQANERQRDREQQS